MTDAGLQYAPPPRGSGLGRRWVRWTLLVVLAGGLYLAGRPMYERARQAYQTHMLRRAVDACLAFEFPPNTIAYTDEPDVVRTITSSSLAGRYDLSNGSTPTALWNDTPWPDVVERRRRVSGGHVNFSRGVLFLGERKNAAGASRLVVVSLFPPSPESAVWVQVLDPGTRATAPRVLSEKRWDLRRSRKQRRLVVSAGSRDPARTDRLLIPMRYGDVDHTLVGAVNAADELELTGGPGWRDHPQRPFWSLDAERQELVEPAVVPLVVLLFGSGNRAAVPAATVTAEGELTGVSQDGIYAARTDTEGAASAPRQVSAWRADPTYKHAWRLRLAPDGATAYAGGFVDGLPALVDTRSGRARASIRVPTGRRHDAAFDADGRRFYVTAEGIGATAFDAGTGRELWRKGVTGQTITAAGGKVAVMSWQDGKRIPIRVLSADDGRIVHRLTTDDNFDRLALSPDGQVLAVTGRNAWTVRRLADDAVVHAAWVESFGAEPVWSPDGNWLAAPGQDFVYVWDLRPPQAIYRLPVASVDPLGRRVSISADGKWLTLATSGKPEVQVWDVARVLGGTPAAAVENAD